MALKPLSGLDDWQLKDASQDIRGWEVVGTDNRRIGVVEELLVDTEEERVASVLLKDGRELSMADLEIGRDVVFVRGSAPAAMALAEDGEEKVSLAAHRYDDFEADFKTHCRSTYGDVYDEYEPVYRWGYVQATSGEHEGGSYDDVASTLRVFYEDRFGPNSYPAIEEAIRYTYDRTRKHR